MRLFLLRWVGVWRTESQLRDFHAEHVRDIMPFDDWLEFQCKPGNMIVEVKEVKEV